MCNPSILFINRVYPPGRGATGRVLRDLARAFAREGWQVTVITSGAKACTDRDGGVRVIRVKGFEKGDGVSGGIFGYCAVWVRMVLKGLFLPATDLVVSMTDPPMAVSAGSVIQRFKKNKHIHWCQDLYPDVLPALGVRMPGFVVKVMMRRGRKAMESADKVIVIGRCMARYLAGTGIDPSRMAVVPNWPDNELLRVEGKEGFNGASYYGLHDRGDGGDARAGQGFVVDEERLQGVYRPPENQMSTGPKFRVLYAGNLGRAHPVETILQAAAALAEEHPEIEFLFVGDGPRYDRLARERANRHLDNIRLLPYQPVSRLRELMESGDVHLVSMRESAAGMIVPCKLYSALAVGRPCIFVGPEATEAAMVIEDFQAGDVVAQGDAEDLAARIRAFRLDGERWFAAQGGAAKAGGQFVPRASIHAWIERARGVLEHGDVSDVSADVMHEDVAA